MKNTLGKNFNLHIKCNFLFTLKVRNKIDNDIN